MSQIKNKESFKLSLFFFWYHIKITKKNNTQGQICPCVIQCIKQTFRFVLNVISVIYFWIYNNVLLYNFDNAIGLEAKHSSFILTKVSLSSNC